MNFNVGVHFKMTTKGSRYSSKSNRGHVIGHAERYGKNNNVYFKNHNVDLDKSKFNRYYKILNPYKILRERFMRKAVMHDRKAIKQDNFSRVYGSYKVTGRNTFKVLNPSIDGYLHDRWLKPLRTVPFKFCTMKEKAKLLRFCQDKGITYSDYSHAVNQGYKSYVYDFNKYNTYMKITRCDTNLDEPGGDHAHIEYLGLGATAKGKPSLSFNNAVKHTLPKDFHGGYKRAMSLFRKQQAKSLLEHLDASFKAQGLDIHFKMVSHARNPKTYINDMALYKQTMRSVDRANAQAQKATLQAKQAHDRKIKSEKEADKNFQMLKLQAEKLRKQNRSLKQSQKIEEKLYQKLLIKFKELAKKYSELLTLLNAIAKRL